MTHPVPTFGYIHKDFSKAALKWWLGEWGEKIDPLIMGRPPLARSLMSSVSYSSQFVRKADCGLQGQTFAAGKKVN